MTRLDLLALTPATLATLANLGLVKRAQREIADGEGPTIVEDADGVVTGTFADGVIARLLPGVSLKDTSCTCGAKTVCRHRVATVLCYLTAHAAARATEGSATDAKASEWSPATLTDETLLAHVGKRAIERARTAMRQRVIAEVQRESPPVVRLPTCTVRFLVPEDLAYARCDCALTTACEHIALAVWAFRSADAIDRTARKRTIELATAPAPTIVHHAVDSALSLARTVLLEGIANLQPDAAQHFARARHALENDAVWIGTLLDDLEQSIDAYRERSARYSASAVALLLTELAARQRAARIGGELPAAFVLGSDEARETLLDHVRLVSVGARLDAEGRTRRAELYLADPDSATIVVLRRAWTYAEQDEPEDGVALGQRSIATRINLSSLAHGQIVSKSVRRKANHEIMLGSARGGLSSVTPQTGQWGELPASLLVRDFRACGESMRLDMPRLLRPRVLAERMRVLSVSCVEEVRYAAGEQRLTAVLRDAHGEAVLLSRRHRRAGTNALAALSSALRATDAPVRFVSGDVTWGRSGLEIDPVAVVTDHVIVPDLAAPPAEGLVAASVGVDSTTSPMNAAMQGAATCLDEGCHFGLLRARSEWRARMRAEAKRLHDVGLIGLGERMLAVVERPTPEAAADAWLSASIRLSLIREAAGAG